MIVVEFAFHSEAAQPSLTCNACDSSHALNSHFFPTAIRRGEENLNTHICSHRRAPGAANERSVHRNVVGKTAFRVLHTVVPVKDDGKLQLVAHS